MARLPGYSIHGVSYMETATQRSITAKIMLFHHVAESSWRSACSSLTCVCVHMLVSHSPVIWASLNREARWLLPHPIWQVLFASVLENVPP